MVSPRKERLNVLHHFQGLLSVLLFEKLQDLLKEFIVLGESQIDSVPTRNNPDSYLSFTALRNMIHDLCQRPPLDILFENMPIFKQYDHCLSLVQMFPIAISSVSANLGTDAAMSKCLPTAPLQLGLVLWMLEYFSQRHDLLNGLVFIWDIY